MLSVASGILLAILALSIWVRFHDAIIIAIGGLFFIGIPALLIFMA